MPTNKGVTSFLSAAQHGDIDALSLYLEEGQGDVNAINSSCETALIQAAKNNQIAAVEFLLDQEGINVAIAGANKFAAIHYAVQRGYFEITEKLITQNPNIVNSKSDRNWEPLHFAVFEGYSKIAKFLIIKGADVSAVAINKGGGELQMSDLTTDAEMIDLINSQGASSPLSLSRVFSAERPVEMGRLVGEGRK